MLPKQESLLAAMPEPNSDAALWAHQRRAAIARAEVIRAERVSVRLLAEAAAPSLDERHLPNCRCSYCAASAPALSPFSRTSGETPSPMRLSSSRLSSRGQAALPEWNNDFIDGCKDGFDAIALEQKRRQRAQAKRKSGQKLNVRSTSCEPIDNGTASGRMSNSGSSPGLRAMAAPSIKGNDGPSTRINFDKRTSRHMNASSFITAIETFRCQMAVPTPIASGGKVKFFARKRPLFDNELQRGEYDVVTTVHGWTIVHMCGMAPDLLRMHIAHSHFPCSEAFGENSTNNELHDEAMSPLVKHAQSGGMATCLMYGATGSGKTYTMTAMQERAAANICSTGAVAVTMLELAGKDVRDLLAPSGARAVTLRENAIGELDLGGASVHLSTTSADLLEFLAIGQQRRTTCGTLMNAVSSRSHMVCFLRLNDGGCLALVDCAGSERKEDSSRHTAERQREGADINSSLLALKECIRALTSGAKHVPYRMSSLTRVLRGSFTTPGAMLHVIATVAPGASDAEHSVATLRMATGLCECSDQVFECKEDVQPVRKSGISEVLHAVPTAVRSRASAPSGGRRNFYSSGASGEQLPVDKARGGGADDVARSRGSAPRSVTPIRRSAYVDVAIRRGEVPCQAASASSTANKARGSGAADAARVRDNARRSVTPTRRSARVDAPIHGEGPCQAASASSAVWPKTEPSRASCGPSRA